MQKPLAPDTPASLSPSLQAISDALARLQFGSVLLTVHEGRLVQMEVTERRRFS